MEFDLWSVRQGSLHCCCSVRELDGCFVLRLSLDGRHLYSRRHQTRESAMGEADALREDYVGRGWVVSDETCGRVH